MEATVQNNQELALVNDEPLNIHAGQSCINKKTNDGSPSEVSIKNLSSQNKVTVSIVLGRKSKRYDIFPKETIRFPEEGPEDFEGASLRVSNTNSKQNEASAEVLLTTNR
jgi:hypothetical protein